MTSYNDRVEGVLLGTAAGDALGAPYEFQATAWAGTRGGNGRRRRLGAGRMDR